MYEKKYEEFSAEWLKTTMMPVPPVIDERRAPFTEIWHYRFIKGQLIEKPIKTEFEDLPLIYFDGSSQIVDNKQFTRPFFWQARDAQKMKNLAAIAMMNGVESMRQTDVLLAKESIPEEPAYQLPWKDPQKQHGALIYNSRMESNDSAPNLPPPIIIPRSSFDPTLLQLFNSLDQTMQTILGSFDARLGIEQKQLSGVAMEEGITQSNATAMPFINNYMDSMNQVAKIFVNLMPKLHQEPRSMQIINKQGLSETHKVNDDENDQSISLKFSPLDLTVKVKSTVNFEIQQAKALDAFVSLMSVSDPLKQFFSSGTGLSIMLDNLSVRGIDQLKQEVPKFMEQQQQQQQQMMQMQMQTNPIVVKKQISDQEIQLKEKEQQIDIMKMHMEQQTEQIKSYIATLTAQAKIQESSDRVTIAAFEAKSEADRTKADFAISVDRHLGEQVTREREHLYKVATLSHKQQELENKRNDQDQAKNKGSSEETGSQEIGNETEPVV
jgi:hypothetical protein